MHIIYTTHEIKNGIFINSNTHTHNIHTHTYTPFTPDGMAWVNFNFKFLANVFVNCADEIDVDLYSTLVSASGVMFGTAAVRDVVDTYIVPWWIRRGVNMCMCVCMCVCVLCVLYTMLTSKHAHVMHIHTYTLIRTYIYTHASHLCVSECFLYTICISLW
jgi:hypothetical protein